MVNVALAHDYLTQRGGAERVVLDLASAFPDAPIYTSLFAPDTTYADFADLDVRASPLNRVSLFRRKHRSAFPLLAPAFSRMHVDADVVICSSAGWAHGISTTGKKIVYCHNPARWLYQSEEYVADVAKLAAPFVAPLLDRLRRWDAKAAHSADVYVANSLNVATRIKAAYGIDAQVCHPAAGVRLPSKSEANSTPDPPVSTRPVGVTDTFLLCVCRLLGYKNVGAVIEGARSVEGIQLVVVGDGPARDELERQAEGTDTVFLQNVADSELVWLYENSQAAISASHEDFGLMPIEAATLGTPSIVLRKGGFVETVVEGKTGEFFDEPNPAAVAAAIRRTLRTDWDHTAIAQHGGSFSREHFNRRMQTLVDATLNTP